MSNVKKDKMPWECVANHLPDWIDKLDVSLSACFSDKEHEAILASLDRYNQLTDKEEQDGGNGHEIFGIEDEKESIIQEIISICEKHKEEAIKINSYTP